MTLTLDALLQSYRTSASTERETGSYYDRLCAALLKHDPVQAEQGAEVWTWADWAARKGTVGKDVGIDLVAKLRGHDGYAAIHGDQARQNPAESAHQRHPLREPSPECGIRTPNCRIASRVRP